MFHIKGIQCLCHSLCSSSTLQDACTAHTYNNAYSTKTSPKLYGIILWCPKGDYYVTSGNALQSFHHCNCTLWIQTLFFCLSKAVLKPQRWLVFRPGEITIALTPKEHFIRASRAPWSRTPVIEFPLSQTQKHFNFYRVDGLPAPACVELCCCN